MGEPELGYSTYTGGNDVNLHRACSCSHSSKCEFSGKTHLDISDCGFEDESIGGSPLGETQFDDGGNHELDSCPET